MKTFLMSARSTCLVSAALLGTLCVLLPTKSSATTYTYTEGSATDIVPSFSFTTSLTGAALDNLAPGTNITGTVSAFTYQPKRCAPHRQRGVSDWRRVRVKLLQRELRAHSLDWDQRGRSNHVMEHQ